MLWLTMQPFFYFAYFIIARFMWDDKPFGAFWLVFACWLYKNQLAGPIKP